MKRRIPTSSTNSRRELYGLKQAGRLWYQKLGGTFEKVGLKRLVSDPANYLYSGQGVKVVVPVFVDDLTILSKSKEKVKWIKDVLAKNFKIRNLGPISFLLGVSITRDRPKRTLYWSLWQYIIDLLERFSMSTCSGVSTPMDPGVRLTSEDCAKTEEEIAEMTGVPYQIAVGALNYFAVASRPDISCTVHKLARYNNNPGPCMWKAVKHLLRYLQETKDLRMTFSPDPFAKSLFTAYSNANHAGNKRALFLIRVA